MYWIEQVERLIQRTLVEDYEFNSYVQGRCFPGELAELSSPEYPLVCYKISPWERDTLFGKFGSVAGNLDVWFWCSSGDPRLYTIFGRFKALLNEQALCFTGPSDERVCIVFYINEPTRSVEEEFGVQALLSKSFFKGLQL